MAVDAARAKSLFLDASELADPAERAAYLERECGGDAALRHRVEALLLANDVVHPPRPLTSWPESTNCHRDLAGPLPYIRRERMDKSICTEVPHISQILASQTDCQGTSSHPDLGKFPHH